MSKTSIEWTDAVWNPARGCSRVSRGCERCYAEKIAARFSGEPESPFYTFARQSPARWTGKVSLVPEKLEEPLCWRKPRRVFVNSMSDLFHEKLSFEDISAVLRIPWTTHSQVQAGERKEDHTYQILTKRPERMLAYFAWLKEQKPGSGSYLLGLEWPLDSVWLGVSVEDQETADERIPILLQTPAAIRFVSYEPALGPIDFRDIKPPNARQDATLDVLGGTGSYTSAYGVRGISIDDVRRLDWLIVGGESGPKARPCDVAWIRRVVKQCRETKTACFVKQMGANVRDRNDAGFEADLETYADGPKRGRPTEPRAWPSPLDVEHDPVDTNYQGAPVRIRLRDRAGADPSEWPEDLRVREFPKVPHA